MGKYIFLFSTCLVLNGFSEDVAKVSEAMGHIIGKNLQNLGIDFDFDAIVRGLKDESEGKISPLNEEECVQAIANLQEEKITNLSELDLQKVDAISNGDQIPDETDPISTSDSTKYR